MRKLYYILILLLFCSVSQADELKVPFSCYPKHLQAIFADRGYKLDLSDIDRTPDSWGFLENKGTSYSIISYKSLTDQDFEVIKQLTMNEEIWQRQQSQTY